MVVENNRNLTDLWLNHIVFTWRWWLGVVLSIIPWIFWIKVRNKKDEVRLLFVGLIVAIVTDFLDVIGIFYGLWYYDYKITPLTVIFIPWDFTLFPVSIMLLLQFKPKANVFIKAIGYSLICAFVFEPFFAWLGIYVYKNWSHWYSFIIYSLLYLMFDRIYRSRFLNRCNK